MRIDRRNSLDSFALKFLFIIIIISLFQRIYLLVLFISINRKIWKF